MQSKMTQASDSMRQLRGCGAKYTCPKNLPSTSYLMFGKGGCLHVHAMDDRGKCVELVAHALQPADDDFNVTSGCTVGCAGGGGGGGGLRGVGGDPRKGGKFCGMTASAVHCGSTQLEMHT